MQDTDEKFMLLALKLAQRGMGRVEPNPAVGCVIVRDNHVIGKGWHKAFGGPHAEVNAIEDCKKHGFDPAGTVMYVTLEPCCHYGKTGSCTDAIIAAGLVRVVIAAIDPSAHAQGKGAEKLRKAGIVVQTGLCQQQGRLLNAAFMKFAAAGRCWVVLKWAQSIDGKVAWASGSSERWISGELSRKDAHKLRRQVGAILVGINTVLADDPLLTPRPGMGKRPVRVVLDADLRIPPDCRLLATAKKIPVLVVTSEQAVEQNPQLAGQIRQKGAELLTVPVVQGKCDLLFVLERLSGRGISRLLVEGGPTVITGFLQAGLADEAYIYITPKILGGRGNVGISQPMAAVTSDLGLYYVDVKRFGDDVRIKGLLHRLDET